MNARDLIVTSRMPTGHWQHYTTPFATPGDVVLDCAEPGCGWHAICSRTDAKQAFQDHYRQHHAHAEQPGVLLLNQPRQ